jgi:hypothetical protein
MIKKKKKDEEVEVKEIEKEIVEVSKTPVEPTNYNYNYPENPNTILLNGANKRVSRIFGLGDSYTLTGFADKPSKGVCTLVFESSRFDVTVSVKGNEYYDLKEELGLNEEK